MVAKVFSSVNVISALPNFHTNSIQFSSTIFFRPGAHHRSAAIHRMNSKVPFIEWVSFYGNFNSFALFVRQKRLVNISKEWAKVFSQKSWEVMRFHSIEFHSLSSKSRHTWDYFINLHTMRSQKCQRWCRLNKLLGAQKHINTNAIGAFASIEIHANVPIEFSHRLHLYSASRYNKTPTFRS